MATMKEIRLKRMTDNESRILEIKAELDKYDYRNDKRLEGYYTDEEWQTHIDYRKALRDEMNGLK